MTNASASLTARRFRRSLFTLTVFALPMLVAVSSAQTAAPGTKAVSRATAAQIAPPSGPRYDNKWEIYGGVGFMNGQAGQNLPKRYNMGSAEVMATYWLTPRLGVAGDYRFAGGTTPVSPNQFNLNRVAIFQNIASGGVQWRGPKGRYAAIDYHALGGVSIGTFDSAIKGYPASAQQPTVNTIGLYSNRSTGWGAAGASVDFNYTPRLAIRLQPDLILEHFGTELREFVAVSGGVVYKFGKK